MTAVIKWNKNNLRKMEREMSKEMNKRIANVNRSLRPIQLTAESPGNLGEVITINNVHNANDIKIGGSVFNSSVGSVEVNTLVNDSNHIQGILNEIRELSKTIMDEDERNELSIIINELTENGKVDDSHKSFFEKHPLISMGISAVASWVAGHGLDKLAPVVKAVFSGDIS